MLNSNTTPTPRNETTTATFELDNVDFISNVTEISDIIIETEKLPLQINGNLYGNVHEFYVEEETRVVTNFATGQVVEEQKDEAVGKKCTELRL